jgi:hypothetical protein
MAFNLVRLSQQDPRWKNNKLGFSNNSTIGAYGCAMTSVCMWLSGFGFSETPDSLNSKLKAVGGYYQDAIVWGAVSSIYPKVKFKNLVVCRDTDAPIDAIGNSIAAGQPVILEVDSSPKSGLQTHWVVAYQKVGKDFYVLDPWPYPTEDGKDISLMARYSQGKELKRSITAVAFYECLGAGTGTPPVTPTDGYYVCVQEGLDAGLRLRSAPSTNSDTLALESSGALLKVIETEATARPKIGVYDQWLRVRDGNGLEGYVAAWYVNNAPTSTPTPPTPPQPPAPPTPPQRVRKSVADGLESVPTALPGEQQIKVPANASATPRLVADIWNRYGSLLGALSGVLGIQPGTAVAVLAIESGGQAFGADGRMIIRFENHIFYQYWGKNNPTLFNKYFTFDTTQRWLGHKWRPSENDGWRDFHGVQASEWDALNFACTLDETAAKMSISMGAPQIMGFNYTVIGYASVKDMFNAFAASDREQVIGFFDFANGILPNSGAVTALKKLDFLNFATYYNGTGQAAYYRDRMQGAYDAFKALAGTVVVPPPQPPTPPPTPPTPPTPPAPPTPPTPPTPPEPPAPPQPPAPPAETPSEPDKPRISVVVLSTAGKDGLNLREKATAASTLLTVEPVGSVLTALDDIATARAQVGKLNQWLRVRDRKGRRGFVNAYYVKEDTSTTSLSVPGVSFDVSAFTVAPTLTVHVSTLAGKGGLLLRKQPTALAEVSMTLPINTPLTVLDDDLTAAEQKVGVFNQWLKVKEPLGAEGYVAAWFVEK